GHDVAALAVRADEVVRVPGRPDRVLADAQLPPALLDHLDRLAVDPCRPVEVRAEDDGVRDMVRVDRGAKADDDDQEEERQRPERDPVAKEAPPGEPPRALARDLLCGLAGRKNDLLLGSEGELGQLCFAPTLRTPGRGVGTTAGSRCSS